MHRTLEGIEVCHVGATGLLGALGWTGSYELHAGRAGLQFPGDVGITRLVFVLTVL